MNEFNKPRPVGSDQAFWWLLDQHHPVHVTVVAQVAGSTTVEAWRTALNAIQRRHPNLSGYIRKHEDGDLWFHHVASAPIPLRVIEGDPTVWEPELAKDQTTRIDLGRAPLARAVLIHQPNLSTLILAIHHSIADAKSVVFAIRDALLVLSGQSIEPLPPMPSTSRLLFHGSVVHPVEVTARETGAPGSEQRGILRSLDGGTPKVFRRTLTPRLTDALLRRCRAEGTTVNGALMAAAVTAARQLSDRLRQAPIELITTCDMRAVLGAGEEVAPLAAGGGLFIQPDPQPTSFWEDARRFKRDLILPKTLNDLVRDFSDLERSMTTHPEPHEVIAKFAANEGEKVIVINLGAPPIGSRFGELTLSAMWGPTLGASGACPISAITVDGSLNLLHTSYKPIPLILDVMEQHLTAACE
jgi:hypothetical protein